MDDELGGPAGGFTAVLPADSRRAGDPARPMALKRRRHARRHRRRLRLLRTACVVLLTGWALAGWLDRSGSNGTTRVVAGPNGDPDAADAADAAYRGPSARSGDLARPDSLSSFISPADPTRDPAAAAVAAAAAAPAAAAYLAPMARQYAATHPGTTAASGPWPGHAGATTSPATAGAATPAPQPPTGAVAVAAHAVDTGGPYRISSTTLVFVDKSRSAPSRGALGVAGQGRTLITTVWYPTDGDWQGGPLSGAPIASAHPFPLIVFAHGFDASPSSYQALLTSWASAGYVVAAPAFPGTVSGPAPDRADVANQPADMSYVISSMLWLSGHGGPLGGAIDAARIGIAGHSDGGETAAAAGLDGCCIDRRVGAVIVMAGAEIALPGGGYGVRHAPALIVQAEGDEINDPSFDRQLYADIPAPKTYLDLHGGSHMGPFTDFSGTWAWVPRATAAFFDWNLKGWSSGPFRRDATVAGVTSLTGRTS